MKKISLNFFGEKTEVTLPSDLKTLRKIICDQFLFSQADAEELVISYIKDFKRVLIQTEADLKLLFQLKDIKELNLDVCESSKLYQEKKKSVEEEQHILYSALEMEKKEENELMNQNSKLIAEAQNQQKEIKDKMRMLKDQLIKIHLDLKVATKQNRIKLKEKRIIIKDLENQLNIPEEQRLNPIEEAKKMFTHEKRGCFGMKKEKRGRKCFKGELLENKDDDVMNQVNETLQQHAKVAMKGYITEMVLQNRKKKEAKTEAKLVSHPCVSCDGCGMKPIMGTRFKCAVCDNFDYCDSCEALNANIHQHPFICIRNPKLSPTAIKCAVLEDMPQFDKNYHIHP